MLRIYKNLIILIFLIIPITTNAHVEHYDNLNRIEFDIFRNNIHIGKHTFSFKKSSDQLEVESEIYFDVLANFIFHSGCFQKTISKNSNKISSRSDSIVKKIQTGVKRALRAVVAFEDRYLKTLLMRRSSI